MLRGKESASPSRGLFQPSEPTSTAAVTLGPGRGCCSLVSWPKGTDPSPSSRQPKDAQGHCGSWGCQSRLACRMATPCGHLTPARTAAQLCRLRARVLVSGSLSSPGEEFRFKVLEASSQESGENLLLRLRSLGSRALNVNRLLNLGSKHGPSWDRICP